MKFTRRTLQSAAALTLLGAFAATPAFAQYGGSPQEQVDGAPGEPQAAPDQDEPDDAYPDQGPDADADPVAGKEQAGFAEDEGVDPDATYPDEMAAGPDLDADVDVDADQEAYAQGPDEGAYEQPVQAQGSGTWQGEDGQTYCRRSDGTTGAIVGGGTGALIGREIGRDGRHYRRRGGGGGTTGTIIGGIIGALVGSAIERSANEQSCREGRHSSESWNPTSFAGTSSRQRDSSFRWSDGVVLTPPATSLWGSPSSGVGR